MQRPLRHAAPHRRLKTSVAGDTSHHKDTHAQKVCCPTQSIRYVNYQTGHTLSWHKPVTLGFYSPIFLVPKKDSVKMIMIFNLKIFNARYLMQPSHFCMISVALLRTIIRPEDYIVSLDMQYAHVQIGSTDHIYGLYSKA